MIKLNGSLNRGDEGKIWKINYKRGKDYLSAFLF